MKSAKRSPEIFVKTLMNRVKCVEVFRVRLQRVQNVKPKTDVKENFNEVSSGCDQLIVIQTDSTKIVVSYKSDFKVYRLWNMTAILIYQRNVYNKSN